MRSVFALELYAIAYSFNINTIIKLIIKGIIAINRPFLILLYIDLKSLYNYFIKLSIL